PPRAARGALRLRGAAAARGTPPGAPPPPPGARRPALPRAPPRETPGGARLWRLAPNEVPRKIEVRRTQAYALLAARRLFEPMRGSTLYEEIDLAAQKLFAVARRPGRGPNPGVADARLEDRFPYLPFA